MKRRIISWMLAAVMIVTSAAAAFMGNEKNRQKLHLHLKCISLRLAPETVPCFSMAQERVQNTH